jgi:hypothetical protein
MEKVDELRNKFGYDIYVLGRRNGNFLIIYLKNYLKIDLPGYSV